MDQLQQVNSLVPFVPGDTFEEYFSEMSVVTQLLHSFMKTREWFPFEKGELQNYMKRLEYSMHLLRLRYGNSLRDHLNIDMLHSGFPNNFAFAVLQTDLSERGDVGLSVENLKSIYLDQIIREKETSDAMLHKIALRTYHDELIAEKSFLPFFVGGIRESNKEGERVQYVCHWAVYDNSKNVPCIYALMFECSDSEKGSMQQETFNSLIDFVRTNSCFMPRVGDLAMAIDGALVTLHPKYLSRVTLGPFYRNDYLNAKNEIRDMLSSSSENEFMIAVTYETIISGGQRGSRANLEDVRAQRVCEVFEVNETDARCADRRATSVEQVLIMSHHAAQHAGREKCEQLGYECLTFDELGETK